MITSPSDLVRGVLQNHKGWSLCLLACTEKITCAPYTPVSPFCGFCLKSIPKTIGVMGMPKNCELQVNVIFLDLDEGLRFSSV